MRVSLGRRFRLWYRTLKQRDGMTIINVGLQSDGQISLDFSGKEEGWNFNQLTIKEARFLLEELTDALQRADRRFPDGTPPDDEDDKDEEDPDFCPKCGAEWGEQ